MKNWIACIFLLTVSSSFLIAQDIAVPDSILNDPEAYFKYMRLDTLPLPDTTSNAAVVNEDSLKAVAEMIEDQPLYIPTWFFLLDSIDVDTLNDESAHTLLDTINYDILSTEQTDSLNVFTEALKQRYIAKYGGFPLIYPKTKVWVPVMGCEKCGKMVKTVMEIEKAVIEVKSIDINADIVVFSYDTSFARFEDSLITILKGKLAAYDYIAYSLSEANDPDFIASMMPMMDGEMNEETEESKVEILMCPIHGHASQESEFPYGRTEEERAGDEAIPGVQPVESYDSTGMPIHIPINVDGIKENSDE